MHTKKNLQSVVDRILYGKASYRILEAGCGSISHLHYNDKAYIVGIDISEQQLQRNTKLSEKIRGDIQEYDFQPSIFDVIVCWDVLEHLSNPQNALDRFARTIKDDGIIILKQPNVFSLKGLLTKILPHPLKVLFYRYVGLMKNENSTGPFRTYMRFSTAPAAIKKFAANNGLYVVYFKTYDVLDGMWIRRKKVVYNSYKILKSIIGFISLGKLSDSEFVIVLQKVKG